MYIQYIRRKDYLMHKYGIPSHTNSQKHVQTDSIYRLVLLKMLIFSCRETFDMKNISAEGIFPDKDCPTLRPALTKVNLINKDDCVQQLDNLYQSLRCLLAIVSSDGGLSLPYGVLSLPYGILSLPYTVPGYVRWRSS